MIAVGVDVGGVLARVPLRIEVEARHTCDALDLKNVLAGNSLRLPDPLVNGLLGHADRPRQLGLRAGDPDRLAQSNNRG